MLFLNQKGLVHVEAIDDCKVKVGIDIGERIEDIRIRDQISVEYV